MVSMKGERGIGGLDGVRGADGLSVSLKSLTVCFLTVDNNILLI